MNRLKRGFAIPPGMADLVDGAKVATAGEGAPPPVAPEAPEASSPVEVAQPPVEAEKAPPAPAPQAEPAKKPWEVATSDPTAVNFRPDAALHAKMEWVSKNVPGGMSRLALLRTAANLLCDQLIAKHYREEV
jgi:hypothetical protein